MSQPLFKFKKTGLQTTVQDLGRQGLQQYGVVASGAMDPFALQVANVLVGNRRDEAALEIALMGPELDVLSSAVIAICGADLSPAINGKRAPMWKSFKVQAGDRITFGRPVAGVRAYLAVAGGYDVPVVMGSKSTYERANLGTVIEKDMTINGFDVSAHHGVGLIDREIPQYANPAHIRVVKGPDTDRFTEKGIETFYRQEHIVSPESDRMGYRLKSTEIPHKNGADIWSDAIPFGTIQVPANGQPIIMMADRQTTGGYTRIATVISVDLPKVSQLPPNSSIQFQPVNVNEAQKLAVNEEKFLGGLSLTSLTH
ncbi:biotin-dependent carboxyltransferase family protein [Lentibacillus sp. CBA3610]|uniref:5-oxoprolinase subunit C family protein n=1 Tax=Lentibacillus sp. CBA3610 TaxID=2518176 RepID=UPI0015956C75|nr:biotin-dependent carboxyltransferase family protein [Lentibacillus sp. CBA3610]QKY70340.1 biotin-dependent carboxyltransferase [Lentibacillus sp. CBA3610]